jgi:6-phosphogluconolactonase
MREIETYPDAASLVAAAAQKIADRIIEAVDRSGYCTIALAGGNTPAPVYRQLAERDLPWDKLIVAWGDERYVPLEHPDRNEAMARRSLLAAVPIPANQILSVPTELGDPAATAVAYGKLLADTFAKFGKTAAPMPVFDIVLLGMGDDGHTASLFPHTAALDVKDSAVTVGNFGDRQRITLTYPAINAADCIMFLVTGENKRTALKAVWAEEGDSGLYPSRGIANAGTLYWLVSQEAMPD